MSVKNVLILLSIVCLLVGCSNQMICSKTDVLDTTDNEKILLISSVVNQLNGKGVFDSLIYQKRALNEELTLSISEQKELDAFINSPDSYLIENSKSDKEIDLVYSIYSEATVADVLDKMSKINHDLADEYELSMKNIYMNMNDNSRSMIDNFGGIYSMKLLINENDRFSRGLFGTQELNWASVNRYVGYSATAIAGALCFKYGIFNSVRYAGLAVSIAGVSCMGVLIARWQDCPKITYVKNVITSVISSVQKIKRLTGLNDSEKIQKLMQDVTNDLKNFVNTDSGNANNYKELIKLIEKNYFGISDATSSCCNLIRYCLAEQETAKQLAVVGTATLAVTGTCAFTGVVGIVVEKYNLIIKFIPDWISISENGVVIKFIL